MTGWLLQLNFVLSKCSWRKTILNLHTLDAELAVLAEEGGLGVTEGSSVKTLEQYSAVECWKLFKNKWRTKWKCCIQWHKSVLLRCPLLRSSWKDYSRVGKDIWMLGIIISCKRNDWVDQGSSDFGKHVGEWNIEACKIMSSMEKKSKEWLPYKCKRWSKKPYCLLASKVVVCRTQCHSAEWLLKWLDKLGVEKLLV